MDKRLYWLWLQYVLQPAGDTKVLLDKYETAENFYQAGESEWKSHFKRKTSAVKRCKEKAPEDFSETAQFCDKHSLYIITPDSEYYPKNLLNINNYPAVLFVRGDYKCLSDELSFGVIGSRTPSVYGENAAKDIVKTLTEKDAVIVSGGALGIDSIAHNAAISNGGKTILVMGCGHGYDYLKENAQLRKNVTNHGACISEYAPFAPVGPNTFPDRNRIISGMSKAVVIVEAAEYSGTFSTANHAMRQGRELFVLPGDINSGNFAGSNRLITEGAQAIFSGEDILVKCELLKKAAKFKGDKSGIIFDKVEEKSPEGKGRKKKSKKNEPKQAENNKETEKIEKKSENIIKNLPAGISKNAEIVYNIMSDGINELDEITRMAQLEVRHVLVALTELEIIGFAEASSPGCYRIK